MDAVIVDWMRSPFHRAHKGALKGVRPDEMAGQVARALLSRNNIQADQIDDLLLGCAYPEGEQGYNVGRLVSFLSGLPDTCLLYTSPSPRDKRQSRMPSSA